jgi:anti-anti-sigma factor
MVMSDHVSFEISESGEGIDCLRVIGRLDARTSPQLIEQCAPVRDRGRHLVLNLGGVTFLSSSGIGSLLALTEEFRERGASLRLAEPSPTVREAIELLNLQEFLTLYETEAEAVKEQAA